MEKSLRFTAVETNFSPHSTFNIKMTACSGLYKYGVSQFCGFLSILMMWLTHLTAKKEEKRTAKAKISNQLICN